MSKIKKIVVYEIKDDGLHNIGEKDIENDDIDDISITLASVSTLESPIDIIVKSYDILDNEISSYKTQIKLPKNRIWNVSTIENTMFIIHQQYHA